MAKVKDNLMATPELSSSNSSDDSHVSLIPFPSPLLFDGSNPRSSASRSWDVAASCQSLLPTFSYLSNKLASQGLHVAIIVISSRPELLSAWPIDIHTQHFLRKLVTRADIRYSLDYAWGRALNDLCSPIESGEAFEIYRTTTYLVHRSLLQKDIIFSGDGLTVIAVDYVHKFKESISKLALETTLPLFRDDRKESCVELLHHINKIYKDIPLSRAYLRRSYTQHHLDENILDEVCSAYQVKYLSAGLTEQSISICNQPTLRPSEAVINILQESPRKHPGKQLSSELYPMDHSTSTAKTFSTVNISFSARTTQPRHRPSGTSKYPKSPPALNAPFAIDPFYTTSVISKHDNLEYSNTQHGNYQSTHHPLPVQSLLAPVPRPKSPKGELFACPRSPPITPPRKCDATPLKLRGGEVCLRDISTSSPAAAAVSGSNEIDSNDSNGSSKILPQIQSSPKTQQSIRAEKEKTLNETSLISSIQPASPSASESSKSINPPEIPSVTSTRRRLTIPWFTRGLSRGFTLRRPNSLCSRRGAYGAGTDVGSGAVDTSCRKPTES